jgi:hypothetical protein
MLASTAVVLLMTPGLAFFYGGMTAYDFGGIHTVHTASKAEAAASEMEPAARAR